MNIQLLKRLKFGAAVKTGGTTFMRSLTIDHTKCGSADSANFTVLVSLTDSKLATTANGGHVQNASGYDIIFTSDSAGTSPLSWEVETYNAATGQIIAWVKVANVSHTADTVFYMNYGNATYTTFQGGAAGSAWNSSYKAVYHLGDGTTLSLADSTTTGNTLTNSGSVAAATGKIWGGGSFSGSNYLAKSAPVVPVGGAARTITLWFKMTSNNGMEIFGMGDNSGAGARVGMYYDGSHLMMESAGPSAQFAWSYNAGWNKMTINMPASANSNNTVIYLNGAAQTLSVSAGAINSTDTEMSLGRLPATGVNFTGLLDEVRVMNVQTTADWELTEYNNQFAPATFLTLGSEQPF